MTLALAEALSEVRFPDLDPELRDVIDFVLATPLAGAPFAKLQLQGYELQAWSVSAEGLIWSVQEAEIVRQLRRVLAVAALSRELRAHFESLLFRKARLSLAPRHGCRNAV